MTVYSLQFAAEKKKRGRRGREHNAESQRARSSEEKRGRKSRSLTRKLRGFGIESGPLKEETIRLSYADPEDVAKTLQGMFIGDASKPNAGAPYIQADVTLGPDPAGGFRLTGIKLTVRGEVEGLTDAQFLEAAEGAKAGCPVSKALTGVEITLDAALEH